MTLFHTNQSPVFLVKPTHWGIQFILILLAWNVLTPVQAQGPCDQITFSFEHYEPCKFRARYTNSTDCYTEIRYLLASGSFNNWTINATAGFQIEVISPSELWVTHQNGFLPLGDQVPLTFTLPFDLNTNMLVAYNNVCAQLGCELLGGIPIESCSDPQNASIIGVKYRECGSLPFSNQVTIPDWTIELLDEMDNILGESVTDQDGNYAFYDLPQGNYTCREKPKQGWTPKVPASGQYAITLIGSQQATRNFGNCPGCSCDSIYMDVVQLPVNSDTCAYALHVTNSGAYCFDNLAITLTSGTFTSVTPSLGWNAVLLDSQHVTLNLVGEYYDISHYEPCVFRVTGNTIHNLSVSTAYDIGNGLVECSRAFSHPCPPPAIPAPCCPAGSTFGSELVLNPDFSLGNQDFTNDYNYFIPGNFTSIGDYSVLLGNQIFPANTQWACSDHTNGSGKMLIVDGYGGPIAWEQSVSVTAGTTYAFSAWVNNLVIPTKNYADPQMALFVGSVPIAGPLTLPETPDQWQRLCGTFTATATGLLSISVQMLATGNIGNDVAIDDISLRACIPPPPCQASISVTDNGDCSITVCAVTTGPQPVSYQWCDGRTGACFTTSPTPCVANTYCVTATCADGSTSSASITYTLQDLMPPNAVCNPGLGVNLNANGQFLVTPAFVDGGSTDNCGIQTLSANPGLITGCGTTIVTLTVTDWCGNTSTCTMGIQTIEVVPPVIQNCPTNQTVGMDLGMCHHTYSPPILLVTDNTDPNPSLDCSWEDPNGTILPLLGTVVLPKGVSTFRCVATDNCGNESLLCQYTVTVQDQEPPQLICPSNVVVQGVVNPTGVCDAVVNSIGPLASDNCPIPSLLFSVAPSILGSPGQNDASGLIFPQGVSTVTYTLTDCGGFIQTCSFTVTVNCPPLMQCPSCPPNTLEGPNLVSNGDFSQGPTAFSTGYTPYFLPGSPTSVGAWSVLSSALEVTQANNQWSGVGHTTGLPGDNFLVLDGISSAGANAWSQTIPVKTGRHYNFCVFVNNLVKPPPAIGYDDPIIEVWINNVLVAGPLPIPEAPDNWVLMTTPWASGVSTTALVEIRSVSNQLVGNDFALDDISLRECESDTCTCGIFADLTYRPAQGAPNINIDCGDTLIADCRSPIMWTLTGNFACEGGACPSTAQMFWELTGPAGSPPRTGNMTASPGFQIALPPYYFGIAGSYQLTLLAICGSDTCRCDFFIESTCAPCEDCLDNLVKNPGFMNGSIPGQLGSSGSTQHWSAAAGSPDLSPSIYCCDPFAVQMWGLQNNGEAICQALNFVSGSTYAVRFEAHYLAAQSGNAPYVQFEFLASNGCVDPFSNCANCTSIGISPAISNPGCMTFTLPNWLANGNYTHLIIRAINATNMQSFGRIDNICIQEVGGGCVNAPPDMVAWWPMDEQTGDDNVADIIHFHEGEPKPNGLVGNPDGPDAVPGKVAGALQFIGTPGPSRFVEVMDVPTLNFGAGSFSIDAWINTNMGTQTEPIVNKIGNSNNGYSFAIEGTTALAQPTLVVGQGNTYLYLQGPPIVVGDWNFVAATVSPIEAKIYVGNANGWFVSAPMATGLYNASNPNLPLSIGKNPLNPHWNITLDELEIFNRELTAAELKSIWSADYLGKCKNIVSVATPSSPFSLRLYPNPHTGIFSIELPTPAPTGMNLWVTDVSGRRLYEQTIEPGQSKVRLDTAFLPNGFYFLKVSTDGKVNAIEKFVKQ